MTHTHTTTPTTGHTAPSLAPPHRTAAESFEILTVSIHREMGLSLLLAERLPARFNTKISLALLRPDTLISFCVSLEDYELMKSECKVMGIPLNLEVG